MPITREAYIIYWPVRRQLRMAHCCSKCSPPRKLNNALAITSPANARHIRLMINAALKQNFPYLKAFMDHFNIDTSRSIDAMLSANTFGQHTPFTKFRSAALDHRRW